MKTASLLIILLLVVLLFFRKILLNIRYGHAIKWIATGYVVALFIIAIVVATKDSTVYDASPARLAEAEAHNEQLDRAFETDHMTMKPTKMWTQKIDETAPFMMNADGLSYYRIVENDQLHDEVQIQLFYNDVIADQIDYQHVSPMLKVEKLDQGLDLVYPDNSPLTVHVVTDRLLFINGQYRRFGDLPQYVTGAAYVRIEVPTGVTVQAHRNFSQFE